VSYKDTEAACLVMRVVMLAAMCCAVHGFGSLPQDDAGVEQPDTQPPATATRGACPSSVLTTIEEGQAWCDENCMGASKEIISEGRNFSNDNDGPVCVVVDVTEGSVGSDDFPITLTGGNDCLVTVNAYGSVDGVSYVKAGSGDDLLCGGNGKDRFFNGGGGEDVLYGGAGDDAYFNGDGGNDVLDGGSGDDYSFYGEEGNDILYGGAGDDRFFYGGEGNDVLYGGDGDDTSFDGGEGNDVFHGGDGDDSAFFGGIGEDTIYDCEGLCDEENYDYDNDESNYYDYKYDYYG